MPNDINQIKAYASQLQSMFLHLQERYALLEPLIFDEDVTNEWGAGRAARGLNVLRYTLFITCVQDVVKIAFDKDNQGRTPCIAQLVEWLQPKKVVNKLREEYTYWNLPVPGRAAEPMVRDVLRRSRLKDEADRRAEFDRLLQELKESWASVKPSPTLKSFRTIRNKISAHTEMEEDNGRYESLDVSRFGLKWGDLKLVISQLQHPIECIGLIVNGNNMAHWGPEFSESAASFWRVPPKVPQPV